MVDCEDCGVRITLMGRGFSAVAHLDSEYGNFCRSCAGSSADK